MNFSLLGWLGSDCTTSWKCHKLYYHLYHNTCTCMLCSYIKCSHKYWYSRAYTKVTLNFYILISINCKETIGHLRYDHVYLYLHTEQVELYRTIPFIGHAFILEHDQRISQKNNRMKTSFHTVWVRSHFQFFQDIKHICPNQYFLHSLPLPACAFVCTNFLVFFSFFFWFK